MIIFRVKKGIIITAVIIAGIIISSCSEEIGRETESSLALSNDGVPVLAYHFFNSRSGIERGLRAIGTVLLNLPLLTVKDAWTTRADDFERHLKYLTENGYRAISIAELKAFMLGDIDIAGKCVVITFDDGDRSVYRFAYPLLEKYNMKGTIFLVTSKAGQSWNDLSISSWEELREMKKSGIIDIESHTHNMHFKLNEGDTPHPVFSISTDDLDIEKKENIFKDLKRSRLALNIHLGTESMFLAWPYGYGTDLSDSLAGAAGFEGILTLRKGRNYIGDSLFEIKRFTISSRTSFNDFKEIFSTSHK